MKIIDWIFGKTKVGKMVEKLRVNLGGYKTYLEGAALAIPAILNIIANISDQGTGYLLTITGREEYRLLLEGIGLITLRAGIKKVAGTTESGQSEN